MMRGIKHTLAFLFGALYCSSIWMVATNFSDAALKIGVGVLIFGSVGLFAMILFWLCMHWKEE